MASTDDGLLARTAAYEPVSTATALSLALLVFRVGVGVVMLAHGIRHIFGGGKIAGTAAWFESLGMKPGRVHAWLASVTEITAGLLLIAGLGMPLAGGGVVGTMTVALITNHLRNGFFIFYKGEGYEYVMTLVSCGLALGTIGAGEWSLDEVIFESEFVGPTGLLVTAVAGFGGAALLLAASWRPSRH